MTTPAANSTEFPDLLGPGMVADPYPVYHRLRAADPVHWHEPFQAWVLTRYDDILPALHDLRPSSDRAKHIEQIIGHGELHPLFSLVGKRMNFTDPPQHTRLRRIVSKAFTPHAVAALRPRIKGYVDQLLDRVQGQGRAEQVPAQVFELLAGLSGQGDVGVPREPLQARAARFGGVHHGRRRAQAPHRMAGARPGGHALLDGGGGIGGQEWPLLSHGIARAGLVGQAAPAAEQCLHARVDPL